MQIDVDLLKKYDRPGPRYTSYPTAPHFHDGFDAQSYREEILLHNKLNRDLSIYVHIPFCASMCYYCACNVVITRRRDRIEEYVEYLAKEIGMLHALLDPGRKVQQIHWGGGTPNYLSHQQMRRLFEMLDDHFSIAEGSEISIEIDPCHLKEDTLQLLRDIGFNRVSLGAQDFNETVQRAIDRVQPYELTRNTCQEAWRLGFESVNVDMIYGLPYQTLESYTKTIHQLIDIHPNRIAVFNYAHVPWIKKHQSLIPEDALPKPAEKLEILKMIIEELTHAGYVHIGMDHFALPEDELVIALKQRTLHRNFQGYSTYAGLDVHALGVTGISQLHGAYAQNFKELKNYYAALDKGEFPIHRGYSLNQDDQLRRTVISEIMCNGHVSKRSLEREFDIVFDEYFCDALEAMQTLIEDDLVCHDDEQIQVRPKGRLLVRNIAMVFDRYLKEEKQRAYSRTV